MFILKGPGFHACGWVEMGSKLSFRNSNVLCTFLHRESRLDGYSPQGAFGQSQSGNNPHSRVASSLLEVFTRTSNYINVSSPFAHFLPNLYMYIFFWVCFFGEEETD
jgi:hypothetical protein